MGHHPYASYLVDDHATALLVDLQCCYCAGAWLAGIVLSISIIDAQLRMGTDRKTGTAKLLERYFTGPDITWLRRLRNAFVHVDIDRPGLSMDDQYLNRDQMMQDAQRAVRMVVHAFFQESGT